MFTGLIETIGVVESFERSLLSITCDFPSDLTVGQSVAINGICLSTTRLSSLAGQRGLCFEVSPETLERTTAKTWKSERRLNLEFPLRAHSFMGGHIVQGHIDAIGCIDVVTERDTFWELEISLPEALTPYVIEKGSIAIDGVSLTVNKIRGTKLSLMLIPETLSKTVWRDRHPGDLVNLEVDMLGKYIVKTVRHLHESNN